jgi:hypothetical protein
MDREGRKDLLEAIGVVAIVASLILVAYELRQNTLMMRAQITQTRADLAVGEQVATYNSDYIPSILVKVESDAKLTDEEMIRYRTYVRGFLRNQDNAYWQYNQGLLDENTPDSIRAAVQAVVGRPKLGREIWESQKSTYTHEFARFVEAALGDIE